MVDYKTQYQKYLNAFNTQLDVAFNSISSIPKILYDAMSYAVYDGGKRVRPVLCFATAEMLGLSCNDVKEFAVAIELIHSYSLVHDDLPAMDNDDYRRGKLSTHKKFGEANGILAGDALLNFAFEHCLSREDFTVNHVKALKVLSEYAGASGMIAGQILDLQNEKNSTPDENTLYSIYYNKTAKLLTAPLLIASYVSGGKYYNELKEFGYNLGVMFQMTDDLMDVEGTVESIGKTPNKDLAADKLTSIKVFGLEQTRQKINFHYQKCIEILNKIPNSQFLEALTNQMYVRKK